MAKSSAAPAFQCAECGWRTTKWSGRCGECQAWGTVEQVAARAGRAAGFGAAALAGLGGLDGLGLGLRTPGRCSAWAELAWAGRPGRSWPGRAARRPRPG